MEFKTGYRTSPPNESDQSEDLISSDTIYGAVVYWFYKLFPNIADDVALNLKVSSLMFRDKNEYYIPKPLIVDTFELENVKKIKKATHVKLSAVENILKNKKIDERDVANVNEFIVKHLMTRNALDRITNFSMPYFIEVVRVKPGVKPFIVVDLDSKYEKQLISAFRMLGDSGIGSDNTYGFGIFTPNFSDIPEKLKSEDGVLHVLLSEYLPSESEFGKVLNGYYRLKRKSGIKKERMERKHEISYIVEGSVFHFKPQGRGALKLRDFWIQTTPLCLSVKI